MYFYQISVEVLVLILMKIPNLYSSTHLRVLVLFDIYVSGIVVLDKLCNILLLYYILKNTWAPCLLVVSAG